MHELLEQYLDKMRNFEELGYFVEALKLSNKLLEVFEGDRERILFEKAKLEFRMGYLRDALLDFIESFKISESLKVFDLIMEAYYLPNKEMLENNYQKNIKRLEEYPYYRNDNEEEVLEVLPIFQDEGILVYLDENKEFGFFQRQMKEFKCAEDETVMMANELWIDDIVECEKSFRASEHIMDMELPVYLVYDQRFWPILLRLYDLDSFVKRERMVFLIGEKSFREYLSEDMAILPLFGYFNGFQNYYGLYLGQIIEESVQELEKCKKVIETYYKTNIDKINARIKRRKPKLLFLTSRFTTVLQYHTRNCMEAVQRMGCEAKIIIEPDGIHRGNSINTISHVAQFQPDIIFVLDHFRFEDAMISAVIPDEIIWITWIQDYLPDILDKKTPKKLKKRDYVMNHFTTWKDFGKIGYEESSLIEAPIPANPFVYKPYSLTFDESERYSCDICFVCHASDVDMHISQIINGLPEKMQDVICAVYKGYQTYVYETGNIFYTTEVFSEFIEKATEYHFNLRFSSNLLQYLAKDMYQRFNQRVFRQVLVDWILDAGFTNIKLWGNGWATEERYKGYAMGPAKNGETLSKIYQASKIVIGNNIMTTSAARAWETMLSGGFYMSNYIPEEEDVTDIRKIIEVGKDVVMFYDKEDLIEKLHYYLGHENERQEMIKRGREAALKHMTFDILMKKVLNEVAERLEENGND